MTDGAALQGGGSDSVLTEGRRSLMDEEVRFAADLYQGHAGFYDRYRLAYPEAMIRDLAERALASGSGRLLDLACGTGQLAFALRPWFSEVWAVDQEPDMVRVVRAKATAAGAAEVRAVVAGAENLDAEPGHFDLVAIGNAFHRLNRDLVAARVFGWLEQGGYLALCWSDGPLEGEQRWQQALAAVVSSWKQKLGAADRVPAGWNEPRRARPDGQVLGDAGFEMAGRREYAAEHRWRLPELAGFIRATSVFPADIPASLAAAFEADLAASVGPLGRDGEFPQTVSFACELARRPA
ncbi:MAG TPA: class I SAM-dependent methyltransferase [Streptosporangiaceae bacterium]